MGSSRAARANVSRRPGDPSRIAPGGPAKGTTTKYDTPRIMYGQRPVSLLRYLIKPIPIPTTLSWILPPGPVYHGGGLHLGGAQVHLH